MTQYLVKLERTTVQQFLVEAVNKSEAEIMALDYDHDFYGENILEDRAITTSKEPTHDELMLGRYTRILV